MAQEKNPNKLAQDDNKKPNKNNNDDPRTFGKEPPMEEPQTPEHPDEEYEVKASAEEAKPTLH